MGRTNFRASSPEALQRRVAAIEATGLGRGWEDGDPGYGPVYVFADPDGHEMGVYYETEWYRATGDLKPALKNQAQAYPGRGVSVRRIDHINYLAVDPVANRDFAVDTLGGMVTEQIVLDDGGRRQLDTFTNKGYDAVWTRDNTGTAGRLHHLSFAVDSRDDVIRAADIALEQGVHIETGPHKHTIQQSFFLYVWEPAGNRIELDNPGARLVFAPDWQPIDWSAAGAGQGSGLGPADHLHVPHARHAAGPGARVSLRIAVLGLGEAGSEIARDLVAAGADVRGYDPKAITVDGVQPRAAARPTRWPTPISCSA